MEQGAYNFVFNKDKNEILKKQRKICFDDVVPLLKKGKWLDVIDHPNTDQYSHQKVYVVEKNGVVYAIHSVKNHKEKHILLKTIYPDRRLRKIHLK